MITLMIWETGWLSKASLFRFKYIKLITHYKNNSTCSLNWKFKSKRLFRNDQADINFEVFNDFVDTSSQIGTKLVNWVNFVISDSLDIFRCNKWWFWYLFFNKQIGLLDHFFLLSFLKFQFKRIYN